MSTWTKYWLFQIPGWIVLILVLWVLRIWAKLPLEVAIGLFALWVIKDLLFYPLLRIAYQPGAGRVVDALVGLKGVTRETLDPIGYILVRGELWRARTEPEDPPLAAGSPVRVLRAEGMTLIVAAEEHNSAASPVGQPS